MNENNQKGMFILYEWIETTSELTDEQFGQLIRGLFLYNTENKTTEFNDPTTKMAFCFLKQAVDRLNDNYLKKKNAGSHGGAPKGNKNASKKNKQNKQKQAETTENNLPIPIPIPIPIPNPKPIPLSGEGDAPAHEGFSPFEIFGKFRNVQLFADQYRTLCMTYGQDATDATIEDLSCKLADGTKQSANHYATLDQWLRYQQDHGINVPTSSLQVHKGESSEDLAIRLTWESLTDEQRQQYIDTHDGKTLFEMKGRL